MTTIIVGLGNPGEKFKNTRHNVGFMVLDKFAEKNDFPEFKLQKKSEALVSEGVINDQKIILAKPQTFMNDSGRAVKEILKNNPSSNLIVIHDDIDLPIGKMKIVKERGSAGHKGVESIIKNTGNDGLVRFRIGITGKTLRQAQGRLKAMRVVLKKFNKAEQNTIDKTIDRIVQALDFFIKEGLDRVMNEYNK